jgi:hypothetical protein
MENNNFSVEELNRQSDEIACFMRHTAEVPYDTWEWDGEHLFVILNEEVVEEYRYNDLRECGIIYDEWIH